MIKCKEYDTIDIELRKAVTTMTPTNAMITYVSKKFGTGSNEAVEMRLMVRGYLLRRGVTYEDCKKTYEYLMRNRSSRLKD